MEFGKIAGSIAEGFEIDRFKPESLVLNVELCYPRSDGHVNTVELGMMCTRAADSIRITYDFERDGWSILQASGWNRDQRIPDMDWQEVYFVKAWARVPDDERG